jgi:hypothetical protein
LTGDALYSLADKQCLHLWNVLFSFNQFRCIVDIDEVRLRGISIVPYSMKFPFQFIAIEKPGNSPVDPFWERYLKTAQEITGPLPKSVGFLQLESPYMHRSPVYATRLSEQQLLLGFPRLYALSWTASI